MGQRHQLFVIAKIKNRYRGLAAVHHQWLYGNGPLKGTSVHLTSLIYVQSYLTPPQSLGNLSDISQACINLIKIFSAPGNRKLLTHELNHAATLTEEVWGRASNSVPTKEDTPFPFVLTCLAIGASFSMDPGRASNTLIHPEDFNLRCDRGDNNDGITVLDISDPANVRHCFMQFPWGDLRDTLSLTPLSAEQYVTDYVPKTDETYIMLDCGSFVKALSSSKLIDIDTLMDAWPDVEWPETKENAEHQDEQEKPKEENSSQKNLVLSLEAMSLNNAFKTAAEHDDGAALLTDVEMLPKFESKLMDYLLTHPDIFKNTASGLTLLSRVVRAASDLDLSPFPSLTDADLLTVAEQASLYQSLRVLDLSGKPNITEDLLANLLPKCTQLQTLILFHTPQLGLNSVLRHLKQSTVQELFHTDHFQRAFDEKYFYLNKEEDTSAEFPCGRGTNFPVVQTWWFICEESDKASPNSNSVGDDNTEDGKPDTTDQSPPRFPWARSSLHGSFLRRGPLAVSLAMRDALLSPANVVRGASRVVEYIRSLDSSDMMRSQLGLAATGCAKALALLGEVSLSH